MQKWCVGDLLNTVTDLESCSHTQSTTLKICECSSTTASVFQCELLFLWEIAKINHFVTYSLIHALVGITERDLS